MAADGQSSDNPERQSPQTIGHYQIEKLIGQGGMGKVYLATDTKRDRQVALKILSREKAANETLVKRFRQEAEAAASLRHPNIVSVFEAGQADGLLYMALEYLPGTDVHRLIQRRKQLPIGRAVEIVRQVAMALDHAAEQGIVHRDIKPSNLLISRDGTVKLTDMGLARFIDEETETGITRAGTTVGTVDYMAPEQAKDSRRADIRSDLYSLGCTWYHMLTGVAPFPEGSLMNKIVAHASAKRPDPRTLNELVSPNVAKVMRKLMASKPSERFQNPKALLRALDQIEDDRKQLKEVKETASEETILAMAEDDFRSDAAVPSLPPRSSQGSGSRSIPARRSSSAVRSSTTANRFLIPGIIGAVAVVVIGLVIATIGSGGDDATEIAGDTNSGVAPDTDPRTDRNSDPDTKPDPDGNSGAPPTPPVRPVPPVTPPENVESKWVRTSSEDVEGLLFGQASDRPFIPTWTTDLLAEPVGIPVRTVGRVDGGPAGQFETLEEALQNIPSEGVTISLQGTGPFRLPGSELKSDGPLTIRGSDGSGTVLTLSPASDPKEEHALSINCPTLRLERLQIVEDRTSVEAENRVLIQFAGDSLLLVDSTVLVETDGETTQQVLRHVSRTTARSLILRSFVRGMDVTPLFVEAPTIDVVVTESMLLAGRAPVVAVASAGDATPEQSSLTILQSACVSCESLLDARPADDGSTGQLNMLVRNSRVGGVQARSGQEPTLVSLQRWPEAADADGRPKGFDLKVEDSKLYGWGSLLKSPDMDVRSALNWGKMWSEPVNRLQLQTGRSWPTSRVSDLAKMLPAKLAFAGGPSAEMFPMPDAESLDRLHAIRYRPHVPGAAEIDVPDGIRTLDFDLNRVDLGREIEAASIKEPTLVFARASGPCYTTPVLIERSDVHIHFVQKSGEKPFRLMPRAVDPSRSRGGGAAMFIVRSGTLKLTGMQAHLSGSDQQDYPRHMILMLDSRVCIDGCELTGSHKVLGRYNGLIEWEQESAPEHRPERLSPADWLVIRNSALSGSGTLIDADMRSRSMWVDNSILVGDTIFSCRMQGTFEPFVGQVAIHQSSLFAVKSVFDCQLNFLHEPQSPFLQFIVDASLFGTAMNAMNAKLFEVNQKSRPGIEVGWLGTSNRIASELRTPSDEAWNTDSFSEAWPAGATRMTKVVNQSDLITGDPPTYRDFEPSTIQRSIALDGQSVTGKPIGADPLMIRTPDLKVPDSSP